MSHNHRKCNTKQKEEMVKQRHKTFEQNHNHSTVHSCLVACSQEV